MSGHYRIKIHVSTFMEKGIPDIIACINGHFVGIEVKDKGKKSTQTEEQKIHQRNIEKAGGLYILAESLEEVKEKLYEKNIINRG